MVAALRERNAMTRTGAADGRLIAYFVVAAALLVGYAVLKDADWYGSAQLHIALEVSGIISALFVGLMALVRFYSFKRRSLHYIGIAFIGTAVLDTYHTVITTELLFSGSPPSEPHYLMAWSWIVPRVFLALMLWLGWVEWALKKRFGEQSGIGERTLYFIGLALVSCGFLYFSFVPTTPPFYPDAMFHRPQELVAAGFFLLAFIGYFFKGDWREDDLEHWLMLSLIVGFFGQAFFKAHAEVRFDTMFYMGHLLKVAGYVLVLVGLLISMFRLFRQAESNAIRLAAANHAKSRFVATISHEIRNPLNAVRGSLGLLKHAKLEKSERELVQVGQDSADALLTMVDNVLDFSKIEAGKLDVNLVETKPVQIVDNIVWLTTLRAVRNRIKLSSYIDPRVPASIVSDPARLRQVLLNLVGNAIKFSPGGHVSIRASVVAGPSMRFEVIDTGCGIAEEDGAKVFQEFSQASAGITAPAAGTGLGLAISKRLVELLGGTIAFTSREGRGSVFWFTVPYQFVGAACRPAVARDHFAGLRVMLVGPDAPWRSVLVEQIGAWGMHIECFTNEMLRTLGPEAGETLGRSDLLIASANLRPDVTSTEMLTIYRALGDKLAVLNPTFGVAQVNKELAAAADYTLGVPILQEDLCRCLGLMTGRYIEEREQSSWHLDTFYRSVAPDGGRILLAEDSQANRMVGVAMLRQFGFSVDAVANGVEAIEALRTLPYDLVLMDLEMPEMDGFEATRRIRQFDGDKRDIPIIAVTANAMADTSEQCELAGMNDHVTKPVDPDAFFEVLLRWLPMAKAVENPQSMRNLGADNAGLLSDEHLDRDALARLARDTAGVPMANMLRVFIDELRERVQELTQAAGAMDLATMERESHSLKSSAATFGVRLVASIATELNRACKVKSQARAMELLDTLTAETEPAIAALVSEFDLEIRPSEQASHECSSSSV